MTMSHGQRLTYLLAILLVARSAAAEDLLFIQPRAEQGASDAVVVGDVALVHTAQLLPLNDAGQLTGGAIGVQAEQVLNNLAAALAGAGSDLERVAKLNVYVATPEGA